MKPASIEGAAEFETDTSPAESAWTAVYRHGRILVFGPLVIGLAACGEAATAPNGNNNGNGDGTNTPPVASIAAADLACVDMTVQLDGTGSQDADGDQLSYAWSFTSTPSGSAATLSGADTPSAEFEPDAPGAYAVQLVVSDGTDEATATDGLDAIGNRITDDITADTTFTAVCPVYHIDGGLSVEAAMTIEPGVTFQFTEGLNHRLIIDDAGSIQAVGTATDTIRFLSEPDTAGSWEGIQVRSASPDNVLDYVEVAHGGRSSTYPNVRVSGGAQIAITNSLLRDSKSHGLMVDNTGILAAFSANTFTNNALAPVNIAADQMGALDGASTYAGGNGNDRIEVRGGDIDTPQSWARMDAPYHSLSTIILYAAVTIEPGATFVFADALNSRLIVESGGSLAAIGTAQDMIQFLGNPATPGTWEGIEVRSNDPDNELTYVDIAHGGRSANYHNVKVNGEAVLAVTNSIIRDSGTWGIYVENQGQLDESNNTYSNNAAGDVRLP